MPFALVIDGVVDTVSFEDHSEDEGWVEVGSDVFGGFVRQENGVFLQPDQPAATPVITDYENAIQNLVDSTAREKQFRDGVTLASYTASTKPKWAAEAQAFVAWRDNAWFYAYGELAKVQGGQRPQPTVDQFLGEIARIAWPVA
ncbi:hypothetical protein [Agrobacterium fabrum]|uniref:hypothetical protein n=1 Tax=Agrobacterium fabrum TaxID=1176649 RepID=UPI0024770640|nr:hypothetical protein [Agrobacterium fabrum]MDH6294691.1 hypothetical protein [Agrobacterium fabrum]